MMVPISMEIVIYAIIVFGIVVLFFILSVTRLKVMPYLYSNARLSARSKYMLSENKLRTISESKNLVDFSGNLTDTDYANNITDKNNLNQIHKSIDKTFYLELKEIIQMSPKQAKPLIDLYLVFTESEILKKIYRKRTQGKKINADDYPKVGIFTQSMLDKISNSESLADLKVILSRSIYSEVFKKEYEDILQFEQSLDKHVLDLYSEELKKAKIYDKNIIINLLNTKYQINNVLLILKSIARGENQQKRLVFVKNTPFENLAKTETIEEFIENSKNTIFKDVLQKAFEDFKHDKSLYHFEIEMYRFYRKLLEKNDIMHYQGSFPLFSYLAKKEFEKRNLYAISKGLDAGFNSKDIMEMII